MKPAIYPLTPSSGRQSTHKKKLQVIFRPRANNHRTLLREMTYKDSLPTTKTLISKKSCRRAHEGAKRKFEKCFGPNCSVISKEISCVGTHGGHQQNRKSYKSFQTSVWFFQIIGMFVCAKVMVRSGLQAHTRGRQTGAFWAAAFFATHPIHTGAVYCSVL